MCSTSTQQHYCLRGCASPAAANDAPTLSWPAAHAGDQTNQSVASVQREAERVAGNRARSSLKWYYEYARKEYKNFYPTSRSPRLPPDSDGAGAGGGYLDRDD